MVLDAYGLPDLTMRRLARDLDVQPSALYHHFANKQTLLAAVADEILARGQRPLPDPADWQGRAVAVCVGLRDAMLAYRDGAEVVATVHAFGLGAIGPAADLETTLRGAGLPGPLARTAARTLLHYVFGHVSEEQTHLQAGSAGAIADGPRPESDFLTGLSLVIEGIRLRREALAG